ncbi:MAG: insulinase family protein [Spirochaetia bacterium]|nr:insulinase family protein [Spirochaetia bacterium]
MLHFLYNNSFNLFNSKKTIIISIFTLALVLLSGCAGQAVQADQADHPGQPAQAPGADQTETASQNAQTDVTGQAEATNESDKANQTGQSQELELNDEVLYGQLDNGLTYYIRSNSRPKDRLQMRLVVDAGSILEQDDQRGLAHFVEHMAFNGTEKYEKDSIIDYLEKTGMSFGPDINASTSFDQTIYKLDLPTGAAEQEKNQEQTTVAKGVDILKEWAFRIAFAPEQVEDEKGVVIEEWRGARGAAARMREEYLPVLFRNSRYAERLPIGKMDVIRAAEPEDLDQFYSAWYRPELMAVVAVGDMEPEKIEALIKETFSGADPRDNPRDKPQDDPQNKGLQRPSYSVPPAEEHEFAVVTDPEAQRTQVQMLSLHEPFRIKTEQDYRTSLVIGMYGQMVRARLSEKTEQSDPPYVNGYFGLTNYLRNNDATVWGALAREGQVERALRTLLEEERRISEFGFTEGELQRAKENLRSRMQRVYEERDKTESGSFAGEYIRHFLAGEAAPGIEREWQLTQKYLPEISLEDIRRVREQIIRSGGAKTTIVTGPEKAGLEYPSPEELRELVEQVQASKVEPYRDDFSGLKLIDKLPEPGSIESTEAITIPVAEEDISYHEFTLSNGAKVVYRQTDYKNEQVLFSAFSYGGASLVEDEDYYAAVMAPSFVQAAGLGEYSPSDLRKLTAGKQAQVSPSIGDLTEGFSGSARPEDLELLFQQVYLYFTAPRRDSDLFQSYQQRLQGVLQNRRSNPDVLLNDTVTEMLFDDHPRRQPYTAERIGEITEDQVYRIFSERFASPADFTFTFVGNLNPQKLKRLAALYLGSIEPAASTNSRESWVDRGVRFTDTEAREEVYAGIAEKSRVNRLYFGSYDWSLEHNSSLESLRKLLEIRLREKVREEAGGTYGVGVSVSTSRDPVNRYLLSITFNCDPSRVEELNSIIDSELSVLADQPVEADYIEKIRSTRSSSLQEALETNGFWLGKLQSIQRHRLDPESALAVGSRIQSTTAESLHRAARSYLSEATTLRAILYPESARE